MSTQLEHVIKSIICSAGPTASAQEAWLDEHQDVRDLHDIIRTALGHHPERTSESTWVPSQPAQAPEPDLGLEL